MTWHRLTIDVCDAAFERLQDEAMLERRTVRDQAAVVVEQALGLRPRVVGSALLPCDRIVPTEEDDAARLAAQMGVRRAVPPSVGSMPAGGAG